MPPNDLIISCNYFISLFLFVDILIITHVALIIFDKVIVMSCGECEEEEVNLCHNVKGRKKVPSCVHYVITNDWMLMNNLIYC